MQSVKLAVDMFRNKDFGAVVPDYYDENVSVKVIKLIQSYTGVINKKIWGK